MADYKNTIDFIKSVYGNQEFTPLAVPVFAGNEKKYLNECIDTTFVSSVGKFVDRFENDMAAYTGATYSNRFWIIVSSVRSVRPQEAAKKRTTYS